MKGKFYGFGVAFLFAASAFALNVNKVQATKTTAFSSNAAKNLMQCLAICLQKQM